MKTSTLLSKNIALAFLFLCILITSAAAQGTGKIAGKLKDSQTNKPVDFASVVLYHLPDSAVVKGIYTDTAGYFQFNNVAFGKYCIKISFLGSKSTKQDNIDLDRKSTRLNSSHANIS